MGENHSLNLPLWNTPVVPCATMNGRKQASPSLVIRGDVRTVASVASQRYSFKGPELRPCNLTQWRILRHQVEGRHEARREQCRFRKASAEYLADLEEKLCQQATNTVLKKREYFA